MKDKTLLPCPFYFKGEYMWQKTLKELLKPPFSVCKDGIVIDRDGWALFMIGCPPILENAKFGDWIAAALNEKWERDFSEPLRWIPTLGSSSRNTCPKCKNVAIINSDKFYYCPFCGQKLDPPEGEKQ
jgi:hypothetical protein